MAPSDYRIYTWVDIEEALLRAQAEGVWPTELIQVSAYWDGLKLVHKPKSKRIVLDWLEKIFPLAIDRRKQLIHLESLPDGPARQCPLIWEQEDQLESASPHFLPLFGRPRLIVGPEFSYAQPPQYPNGQPPIVAVHSFKGGVGKTLHALALAQAISRLRPDPSVLLIDGDLEAPGLSWLLERRLASPPISYTDLLTIAHGDPEPQKEHSLELVAARLREIPVNGVYILPAYRDVSRFKSLEIRPEHLLHGGRDPFLLTHLLSRLGSMLGVEAVIIDLRAGLSELSSALLLDPRVHRLLVTNMSGQSLSGQEQVLNIIAERAPITDVSHPLPTLLFSFVTPEMQEIPSVLQKRQEPLISSLHNFNRNKDVAIPSPDPLVLISPMRVELLSLSLDWDLTLEAIERNDLPSVMAPFAMKLPLKIHTRASVSSEALNAQRSSLKNFLTKLENSSHAGISGGILTAGVRRFATDLGFRGGSSAVVGPPGSGKTHLFLEMLRMQTLSNCVSTLGGRAPVDREGYFFPLLAPRNLTGKALDVVRHAEQTVIERFGLKLGASMEDLRKKLSTLSFKKYFSDSYQWISFWVNCVAWRLGLLQEKDLLEKSATDLHLFRDFISSKHKEDMIILIDGLDDMLDIDLGPSLGQAMRMLSDLPHVMRNRNVSLIPFVDSNEREVRSRWFPRWTRIEFLTFLTWIMTKAGIDHDGRAKLSSWTLPLEEMDLLNALQYLADHTLTGHMLYNELIDLQATSARGFPAMVIQLLKYSIDRSLLGHSPDEPILTTASIKEALRLLRETAHSKET